jgi:hypothetical protein
MLPLLSLTRLEGRPELVAPPGCCIAAVCFASLGVFAGVQVQNLNLHTRVTEQRIVTSVAVNFSLALCAAYGASSLLQERRFDFKAQQVVPMHSSMHASEAMGGGPVLLLRTCSTSPGAASHT